MDENIKTFLEIMRMIFTFILVVAVLYLLTSGLGGLYVQNDDDIDLPSPTYTVQCFQNGNVVLTEHITGKLDSAWFKNEFTITNGNGAVSIFNGELCIAKNTDGKIN